MIRLGLKRRANMIDPSQIEGLRSALGKRSLVMVGMMGCGKTAIGRRLAQKLELPFADADDEIEKAAGKSIPEIFKDHGEEHFREGERKVISRLLHAGPQVLATGGGAFMNEETRKEIGERGISIWLKAELPVLLRRVGRRDSRPLLRGDNPEAIMTRLLNERSPVYAKADLVADSRDEPHDQIVAQLITLLLKSRILEGKPKV